MAELGEQGKSMLCQEVQKRESWEFHYGIELKELLTDHQTSLGFFFQRNCKQAESV